MLHIYRTFKRTASRCVLPSNRTLASLLQIHKEPFSVDSLSLWISIYCSILTAELPLFNFTLEHRKKPYKICFCLLIFIHTVVRIVWKGVDIMSVFVSNELSQVCLASFTRHSNRVQANMSNRTIFIAFRQVFARICICFFWNIFSSSPNSSCIYLQCVFHFYHTHTQRKSISINYIFKKNPIDERVWYKNLNQSGGIHQ